jgi:urease subunit beta
MTNELLVLTEDQHGHKAIHNASDCMHAATYPDTKGFCPDAPVPVGGEILSALPVGYNMTKSRVRLRVRNTGDRPIQVGSHFHFFEVNRYLLFDRPKAYGMHLDIPATTAIRFEPGDEREVDLVNFGGKQRIVGFNGLTSGYAGGEDTPTYFPTRIKAIARMLKMRFRTSGCGCNDGDKCTCAADDCHCNDTDSHGKAADNCHCQPDADCGCKAADGCGCQTDADKCDCDKDACACDMSKKPENKD